MGKFAKLDLFFGFSFGGKLQAVRLRSDSSEVKEAGIIFLADFQFLAKGNAKKKSKDPVI